MTFTTWFMSSLSADHFSSKIMHALKTIFKLKRFFSPSHWATNNVMVRYLKKVVTALIFIHKQEYGE